MIEYEENYLKEVKQLSEEKFVELELTNKKYEVLRTKRDRLTCQCVNSWIKCEKCSLTAHMDTLEYSVKPYEKRLPDDVVLRSCIIFHHKIPNVLFYYRESCALLFELFIHHYWLCCVVSSDSSSSVEGDSYQWKETPFNRRMAIGSHTKSFLNTHLGHKQSILSRRDNFILPQGKDVNMVMKLRGAHLFLPTTTTTPFQFDVSNYCKMPVYRPFTRLEFGVHGVNHNENQVIALQCECPTDLQLIAFKDFGNLRASGGSLQWRNIAAALGGVTLDLCDPSVVSLILQSVYQVGPVPTAANWNTDLTEVDFVRELCHWIGIVLNRIEESWSSYRALHVCIAVASYVVQNAPSALSSGEPWNLLMRCRKIAVAWSNAIEKLIELHDSSNEELMKKNWFVNGLIVLTFGTYTGERSRYSYEDESNLDQDALCTLVRARILMFEQAGDVTTNDFEVQRLHCLCYRIIVRWEKHINKMLTEASEPLSRIVRERWRIKQISWQLISNNFFQGDCITMDDSISIIHIHVVEGIFLADGAPIGRLPHRIIEHPLFKRTFANPFIAAFHRGGGVFEGKIGDRQYTFAYEEGTRGLIVKEIDSKGSARRLLDPTSFTGDLPEPLITDCHFWMSLDDVLFSDQNIELRPLNRELEEPEVKYQILLPMSSWKVPRLHGRVIDCKSNRTMLNFRGVALSHLFTSLLWRLDEKKYLLPWLPRPSDDDDLSDKWSLCIELHRLHLHAEIWNGQSEGTRIVLREFDTMSVSSSQFLETFVGLKHMLVLERDQMRTVIVPNFNLKTERSSVHHKLVPASFDLNEHIPFFAFDVDEFLRQMRPNGTETYVSWLMCAYLHAVTSSAMKDPLTRLTGLEMAVTQLRRCYFNKPLDKLCKNILQQIAELSVKRDICHDTEIVCWDETRSGYSSSEVYVALVHCILTRCQTFTELHPSTDSDRQYVSSTLSERQKIGYAQYEWIYSAEARLDAKEKQLMCYSVFKAPKIEFPSRVSRKENPIYQVMHAFRCQKALDSALSGLKTASTINSYPQKTLPPPLDMNFSNHVGLWSDAPAVESWLWLYLEALECRSQPTELDRAERLAFYLSFVVYKWMTTGSHEIDLLLQVALSEYPPSSYVQDRINNSINHYLQPLLLDCETEKSPAQLRSLELPHEMAKQLTLHLNRLIPRLILANQPIIQHKCKWSCDKIFPSSVQLLCPVFIERDELGFISACLSADADVEKEIFNGKSEEIELAFAKCLSAKPRSTRTASSVNFPFSTLPTSKN